MRHRSKLTIAILLTVSVVSAQEARPKPSVWISPSASNNGSSLREMFEHPDDWKETRALTDVLFYTDLNFNKQFSEDELRAWFGKLHEWNIKLAMEVGAIKEWGVTGEKTFNAERPMWEKFQRLGADFYAIALDEPLTATRNHLQKPDDYAVEETANYIALVRAKYPQMLIGDIEPYPSISLDDHKKWIEALQQKLAEKNVRGLDFYRLDVDSMNFTVRNKGSWNEVRQLEQFCRQKKLPYSQIYWAAGYPAMQKRGVADDSTWYVSMMGQGYDYFGVGGTPDQYVIESWVGAPSHATPETGDWTFTRSVRDFVRKFVKRETNVTAKSP